MNWKIGCTFLILLVACNCGCGQRSRAELEAIIAKSETLRQIDQVCTDFPRPTSFELEKKSLGGNAATSAIEYQYVAHMPFEEVKVFYQDSKLRETYGFQSESYKEPLLNKIKFQRGDVSITIENGPPSWIVGFYCSSTSLLPVSHGYPPIWFAPIDDPKKSDWEILPQEAKPGEVILSKRNELGILSNFAATPFVLDGKRYASVEGFWQMMLYPEGPDDERARDKSVTWKYTREQVAQMTAFEAKAAGTLAEENMKKLGIDWVTYNGKRFPYRSQIPGEHYRLIVAAMRAKLDQNPEVKRILLATGDLILKPDHHGEENPPPEWKYYEMWMQLRAETRP